MLDQRGQLLRAAVGFAGCSMPSYDRALHALRFWLDSWSGIGHVAVGMARQGYDLQLTRPLSERSEPTAKTPTPGSPPEPAPPQEQTQPQEPTRSSETAPRQGTDEPDPRAVIDWLLKERR